ncbi:MAG: hypothetical protein ACRD2Y_11315 [Terriglobales bacterium]
MPDLDETMCSYADKAVAKAREGFRITLDFSPASVERVEEMAATIHNRRQRRMHADEYGDPSPDWDPSEEADYPQLALALGAYLGEVIRRRFGGAWENPGQGARLRVRGEDLNPCGLAYFRITQGHDNLRDYFERVAKKLESQNA